MTKSVVRALVGGAVVYVMVVACSSPGQTRAVAEAEADSGGYGGAPQDDERAMSQKHDGGGLVDALLAPVPDAHAADAPVATSGSRLKARWQVGEDGSRQFLGWFDSQRNENCEFVKASDGKIRCLPIAGASPMSNVSVYLDANRTRSAIMYNAASGCRKLVMAHKVSELECVGPTHSLYQLDTVVEVREFWTDVDPSRQVVDKVGSVVAREVGAEIPPTAFVAAEVQVQ